MGERDDLDRLRLRAADLQPAPGLALVPGAEKFVGQVVTPQAQIAVGAYLMVNPVDVFFPETEGQGGSYSPPLATAQAVLLLGPAVPNTGDYLVCVRDGARWVTDRFQIGGSGVTFSGCPCHDIPLTLYQEVNDTSLNFGLFQPCTFVYGPTPAVYLPLSIGTSSYLSTQTFPEPSDSTSGFQYWFTCYSGYYSLGRVYAQATMGSPFRDQFRYTWLIGIGPSPANGYPYGNTCSPFYLGHGTVYTGGDPNSKVFIHP